MKRLKLKVLRPVALWLIGILGSDIHDVETGKLIGHALLVPWRGRILVLGGSLILVPKFCPQQRLTYWKREMGFTEHPAPDFPHELRS